MPLKQSNDNNNCSVDYNRVSMKMLSIILLFNASVQFLIRFIVCTYTSTYYYIYKKITFGQYPFRFTIINSIYKRNAKRIF